MIEREYLACCMRNPDLLTDLAVKSEHFDSPMNQLIYQTMIEYGQSFDAVLINQKLFEQSEHEAAARVLDIMNDCTGIQSNAAKYAVQIRNNHRKRRTQEILQEGMETLDAGAVVRSLMELDQEDASHETTIKQAMSQALQDMEQASEGIRGITTGLSDLDKHLGGWHKGDLCVIGARPAMGKEQPNSSLVLLADGKWKEMGNMQVGDLLASVDGAGSVVEGVYPQGKKQVFKFTFADGRTARAGIDHLWEIKYRDWKSSKIKTTAEIIEMLKFKRYKNRLSVRLINGEFGGGEIAVDPWFLGFMIGDGNTTTTTPRFSTDDKEIIDRIDTLVGKEYSINKCGDFDYRISGTKGKKNKWTGLLDNLGVYGKYAHEKRIPEECFALTLNDRLELLRGLLDADGWCEKHNSIQFCTTSPGLAHDVENLVRSVGGLCSTRTKKTAGRLAYIQTIRRNGTQPLFGLTRKQDRVKDRRFELRLTIKSIAEDGEEQCTCIKVSHPTALYITDNYTVTHNTALLLHFAQSCNVPLGLVSAEQPAYQIAQRHVASIGKVRLSDLRQGKIGEHETKAVISANHRLKDYWIFDRSAPTVDDIVKVARRWKHRHDIEVLFVDYIQRIQGKGKARHEQVGDVVRSLKTLARDLNIPVVALAQVARQVEGRDNKRPGMGDLSDSSEIEKEADQIITMYRDEVYNKTTETLGICELKVCKNRHGYTGTVDVRWIGEHVSFANNEVWA